MVTGRAARRRERRTRPPPPQRQGLDAVRWVAPPSTPARPAAQALRERFPALADRQATPLLERFTRGEIVAADGAAWSAEDRKSTRLNSSHVAISYAVFCLKKKKKKTKSVHKCKCTS